MAAKPLTNIFHYREKGWLDVGKSRMMLVDILQGFYNLREVIKTEVGENASYVIFQAGIKGSFSFIKPLASSGRITPGPEGFSQCLTALTEGGCGDLRLKEMDWQKGYARVTCDNTFEGWAYVQRNRKSRVSSCDYTRGLILGFMKATHHHSATGLERDLDCVEISCIATGKRRCEFIVGNHTTIRSLGHQSSAPRQSIRQQLGILVDEKTRKISETKRFNERILKYAPVGIFTVDSNGTITSANRAIAATFGTQSKRLVGMPAVGPGAVLPVDFSQHLERVLEGKPVALVDYPLEGPHERFVTVKGIPLKHGKGHRKEGCLCIVQDTTQSTLNARWIEYLKNYNENVINSIVEGIVVVDFGFRIKIWNDTMENIFGIKAKKVLGKKLHEVAPSVGGPELIREWIEEVLRTGKPVRKKRVHFNTGTRDTIILNLRIIPFYAQNKRDSGLIILHEDVTDVERSEIRYQNLFETAQDGICLTDPKGRVISANRKILEALEVEWEQLQGMFLERFLPADNRILFKEMVAMAGEGREVEPREFEIISLSGKQVPVEMSINAVKREDKVYGFHIISRDILKRKQMESRMIESSKLAAVGELASCVAHEINNPMASVAGYAEELLDLIQERKKLSPKDIKEFQDDLGIILEQANRCKKITENLLSFARPGDFDLLPTRLNEVVENTVLLVEPQVKHTKIRIIKDLQPDLPLAETSPAQLQQVFLNILINAAEALDGAGIIKVISRAQDGLIRIRFQDDGPGISEENMKKLFIPFFTTKSPVEGTGLGLSICQRIMEKLMGTIEVESQIGQGAAFTVHIPERQPDSVV